MSGITQCPTCQTRFKVSDAQLESHHGLVRCGRCEMVFNARERLEEEGVPAHAGPGVAAPVAAEPAVEAPAIETRAIGESVSEAHVIEEPAIKEPAAVEEEPTLINREPPEHFELVAPVAPRAPFEEARAPAEEKAAEHFIAHVPEEPAVQVHIADRHEEPVIPVAGPAALEPKDPLDALLDTPPIEPEKKNRTLVWALGSFIMLLALAAEAAYFFRVELAAVEPGLKPALVSYCDLLGCEVPLPRKADMMGIESSELAADPAQSSVIALNALLRNHAPYAQAYPDLELTLTDAQEKPLARRAFHPADYLKPGSDEKSGLPGNRELNVTLNLDTTDLHPSGYRLFLYYSQ